MGKWLLFFVLFSVLHVVGQVQVDSINEDSRYFEDQFYLGVTYNIVRNRPDGVAQQNLSYGLQVGFIKDLPLNGRGTRALGIGLGLGLNTYYSNLLAAEGQNGISYSLGDSTTGFKRSKLETHSVEFPLEFRWRNSTLEEYKFWRLYAGIKAAYLFGARSTAIIDGARTGFNNTDVERFQYGLMLNVGYNTFNIHVYHALNDLFSEGVTVNNQIIGFSPLRIGVIFYIL
ncbi:porin family protein [Maribacter chungangensis]|uniref:Porin family protein n=1 Tax=Maribacter chungangensis TaxID=1069117 RepID=A0ABW3AZX2_9FLAO